MADGIIVGGIVTPVVHPETKHPVPVFAWCDPPGALRVPEFRAGDGYNKSRIKWPVDLCVWHWTGGEAEPDRMAETLRERKLGVEFAVSRAGNIFQFCDPRAVDTADAGGVNNRSVGVEVVNYGYAAGFTIDPVRAIKVPTVPKLGKDRETYEAMTHGRVVKTAKLYPAQMAACIALAEAISASIPSIPRSVPLMPAGVTGYHRIFPTALGPSSVLDRSMEPARLSQFAGHIGHYQITDQKRDPGPWFMEQLYAHFTRG